MINEEEKKEKSRKISIIEGSCSSVATGLGHNYISPFAIAMQASNSQIAILSSLPSLISSISQLFGANLIDRWKRKKIIFWCVFLEALTWLPIFALGILNHYGILNRTVNLFIIVYCLLIFLGALGGPSWFSLMGDIVPQEIRGKYFSIRNTICGTISLTSMIFASFFLDFAKSASIEILGFSALFIISAMSRMTAAYFFTKQYEPKLKMNSDYYFSLWSFIVKSPSNNFGKFSIYNALFRLSVMIAAPFFAVYMLSDLNLSYFWYTAIVISGSIFSILSMKIAGRYSDDLGNKLLIKLGAIMVTISPFLWIFSGNVYYIIFVPQLIGGIGWTFFDLGSNNYIYECVTPQRRSICVAYLNVFAGTAIFIGGLLAGFIVKNLNITFMNPLLIIFLISGIARGIISWIMVPKLKEVRKIKKHETLVDEILKETGLMNFNEGLKRPSVIKSILLHPIGIFRRNY